MSETRDTRRGIQNVQERVSSIPSRETVGERHLRGGKWGGDETRTREIEKVALQEEQEAAMAQAEMIAEAEESRNQSLVQHAIKEKAEKMLLKKLALQKTFVSRSALRATLWYALIAYAFQVFFAIGAMVGFGAHAMVLNFKNENVVGKILGFFVDFENELPCKGLGYIFWGLGIILSLALLVGYLIFFRFIGISVLQNSVMFFIMVVCFAFNITPFINIFPWLLLWVIYMSLFSTSK